MFAGAKPADNSMMRMWIVIGVVTSFGVVIANKVTVCRDVRLKCGNTGSTCSYREWFGLLETGYWRKPSVLESFLRENYPKEFTNRWQNWNVVRCNVFGSPVVACGGNRQFPPPDSEILDRYVERLPGAEKKALYDFFRSADSDAAEARMSNIWCAVSRSADVDEGK
jgi:hypothetical protein